MESARSKFIADFFSGTGGEVDECSITLRFSGDDLNPESITALLEMAPTESCRKGELRVSGKPGLLHTGLWLLECERTDDTADNQIRLLLQKDLPDDLAIWQSLAANFVAEIRVNLFPARWARGTIISSETIKLMADRGLQLYLDIYSKFPPAECFE